MAKSYKKYKKRGGASLDEKTTVCLRNRVSLDSYVHYIEPLNTAFFVLTSSVPKSSKPVAHAAPVAPAAPAAPAAPDAPSPRRVGSVGSSCRPSG